MDADEQSRDDKAPESAPPPGDAAPEAAKNESRESGGPDREAAADVLRCIAGCPPW